MLLGRGLLTDCKCKMWYQCLLLCLVLFSRSGLAQFRSGLEVRDGRYTRLTVRVEDQAVPKDQFGCDDFLNKLEKLLNSTSYGLYELTGKQAVLEDIQIHLPRSWASANCALRAPTASAATNNTAQLTKPAPRTIHSSQYLANPDVTVAANELFHQGRDAQPWAEQHAGCGQQGLRVHVPAAFVKTADTDAQIDSKGQTLLREWCKYRYGVFPESGFRGGDPMYPHVYNEGNRTLINAGCEVEAPFCPLGAPYNRRAPTKQNILCKESSAIETILNHRDFDLQIDGNKTIARNLTFKSPNVSFFLPTSSKYTIVLERTAAMEVNGRWTSIRRSLFRFIEYLPVGSELSIVTFGKEATLNLPPTVVTEANRDGLHGRVPRKVLPEDLACVFCALNMTLGDPKGDKGTIILVTGSPRRPQLLERLIQTVDENQIKVFPIIYPDTAYPEMIELARHGKHFSVPEDEDEPVVQGQSGKTTPQSYLTKALLDVLRASEGLEIQQVHASYHLAYEFAGTFTLDDSMLHKLSVTLTIDDEERVEFFEITNPSGEKHLFSKFEDGMVVFTADKLVAQPGIWTYHAKLYQNSGLPREQISVDVVSVGNGADADPVVLDVFTSVANKEVDAYKTPIILYARLTQGSEVPVLEAEVTARVFRPGSGTVNDSSVVTLTLRDDGSGEPDLTRGDGLYSAYFSNFASVPGFYAVEVTATSNNGRAKTVKTALAHSNEIEVISDSSNKVGSQENCCGSRIHYRDTVPAAPFHRQAAGSGFYVKQGISPRTDISPPSRILDFHVARIVEDSLYVQLEWTAPGGDYDSGRASRYEIRCYTNRDALKRPELFKEMGILVHSSFTPEPVSHGQIQTSTVGVPWTNEAFFYAIVAFDETGNRSPVSNIISVFIPERPSTTPVPAPTDALIPADGSLARQTPLRPGSDEQAHAKKVKTVVIAGVVLGVLALMALVILIIFVRVRTKRAEYDADERDTYRAYEPSNDQNGMKAPLPDVTKTTNDLHVVVPSVHQSAKNLSRWLDSLPRSEDGGFCSAGRSPNTTGHDLSLDAGTATLNRATRASTGTHSLTKTNPYRHKMLTNGSFLNLKDCGNSGQHSNSSANGDDSSRPTTSTEESSNSDSVHGSESGDSRNSQGALLRRSNTTAAVPSSYTTHGYGHGVIDTGTARAIIDTYSGNLFGARRAHNGSISNFGGSGTYCSFRGYPSSVSHNGLFVSTPGKRRDFGRGLHSVDIDQDSLEPSTITDYPHAIPPPLVVAPASTNNEQKQRDYESDGDIYRMTRNASLRTRTESVV